MSPTLTIRSSLRVVTFVVLLGTGPLVACGSTAAADASSTPGPATSPAVAASATCDASKDPKDSAACLTDDLGIFVDGRAGDDLGAGSRGHPVRSITSALGKLDGRSRVFVCGAGPYPESIRVDAHTNASIFGGFDCADWSYNGKPAQISPTDSGFVVALNGTTASVVLSDLTLQTKDDTSPGASSIAVFGYASARVTLRRTSVIAGRGIDGADGVPATAISPAHAPSASSGAQGGTATSNPLCATSIGGAGGRNGSAAGGAGAVTVPTPTPFGYNGKGGIVGGICTSFTSGQNGSFGEGGASGPGAPTIGTFDGTGWRGTDGQPGGEGGDGQGGGGGAQITAGYVGSSGSPGGCGGRGGASGKSGGSSIAILALQTTFALEQTQVSVAGAGRGGNGAKGQTGQLRATTFPEPTGDGLHSACFGGLGGFGGSGGGGGGASGGMSIGILYTGSAPLIDGALTSFAETSPSIVLGEAGIAGRGGAAGDTPVDPDDSYSGMPGVAGTDGLPGATKAVLEFQ